MADLEPQRPTLPHPGVDPQSWLGFEQRIQSRRFDALIASANAAIAAGNVALALHALDEAREIRPRAVEVEALQAAVQQLEWQSRSPTLARRAAGALMLFAAGVLMFIALDQARIVPEALPVVAPPPPRLVVPLPAVVSELEVLPESLETDVPVASEPPPEPAVPTLRTTSASATLPMTTPAILNRPTLPPAGRSVESAAAAIDSTRTAERTLNTSDRSAARALPPSPRADADPGGANGEHRPPVNVERGDAIAPDAVPAVAVPPPTVAAITAADEAREDESRVADVLRRYARAYGELDVSAAREVWPNVDQRALSRAFESLASQTLSFDECAINVQGASASASCRGQASYVGKVGRGEPRIEPRTWRFELRRDGESWKIANAQASSASH